MFAYADEYLAIFGPGYRSAVPVVRTLAAVMLLATGCGMVDMVLAMGGRTSWNLINVLIALAATTGLYVETLILPALLLIQFLLIAGIGFFLAPLQVHFRDVRQIVAIAISIGFWLTPVFYRRVQVPPEFAFMYDINPMAQLIEAQRGLFLEGAIPNVWGVTWVGAASLALFVLGYVFFAAVRPSVPEQL